MLAPDPGDLGTVTGLTRSRDFTLRIDGREAFVYHAAKTTASALSAQGVNYCSFAFTGGPVTLTLGSSAAVREWLVQPTGPTPIPKSAAHSAELIIGSPRKLLVTARLESGGERYFILSAEPPESGVPAADAPGVLWLGPGVHRYGRAWNPYVNGIHTVYLAPGAVVEATLKVRDRHGIRLLGRGLFIQAAFPHGKTVGGNGWYCDYMGMYFRDCTDLTIEGIASLGSPSFQLEVANCDRVSLRNLKLCGFGDHNNDGMHLYSRNVVAEDCFIAGNDDRICLNGLFDADLPPAEAARLEKADRLISVPVHDVLVRRMVFWGLKNGGDIMITWNAGQSTHRIVVEDCDSLAATNKAFVTSRHAGSGVASGLLFRHCRIEHGDLVDLEVADSGKYWGRGGGRIGDITFEDISLAAAPSSVGKSLRGRDPTGTLGPLTFTRITANGQPVTVLDQTAINTGDHVLAAKFIP